jgi:hypothetical protein
VLLKLNYFGGFKPSDSGNFGSFKWFENSSVKISKYNNLINFNIDKLMS